MGGFSDGEKGGNCLVKGQICAIFTSVYRGRTYKAEQRRDATAGHGGGRNVGPSVDVSSRPRGNRHDGGVMFRSPTARIDV